MPPTGTEVERLDANEVRLAETRDILVPHIGEVTTLLVEWAGDSASDKERSKAILDTLTDSATPEQHFVAVEQTQDILDPEVRGKTYISIATSLLSGVKSRIIDGDDGGFEGNQLRMDGVLYMLAADDSLPALEAAATAAKYGEKLGTHTSREGQKWQYVRPASSEDGYATQMNEIMDIELGFLERCDLESADAQTVNVVHNLAMGIVEHSWTGIDQGLRDRAARLVIEGLGKSDNPGITTQTISKIVERVSQSELVSMSMELILGIVDAQKAMVPATSAELDLATRDYDSASQEFEKPYTKRNVFITKASQDRIEGFKTQRQRSKDEVNRLNSLLGDQLEKIRMGSEAIRHVARKRVVPLLATERGRELMSHAADNFFVPDEEVQNLPFRALIENLPLHKLQSALREGFKESYAAFARGELVDGVDASTLRTAHDYMLEELGVAPEV